MYEVIGWLGAVAVLVAYGMVTRFGTSRLYHWLNIAGACGLLANALHHRAFPSTFVNVIWVFIGAWGITRIRHGERPTTPNS